MLNLTTRLNFLLLFALVGTLSAQNKFVEPAKPLGKRITDVNPVKKDIFYRPIAESRQQATFNYRNLKGLPALHKFDIQRDGASVWIKGTLPEGSTARKKPNDPVAYVEAVAQPLGISGRAHSYKSVSKYSDKQGMQHHKMQQMYNGIPVFLGEIILHENKGKITSLNGHIYEISEEPQAATLLSSDALQVARSVIERPHLSHHPSLRGLDPETSELVVYVDQSMQARYAWHVQIIPNIFENWEMIIDASTGEILNKWSNICSILGHTHDHTCASEHVAESAPPVIGSGTDLNGQPQELRLFEENGTFFMFDDSREMFRSYGDERTPPAGAIITFEMENDESSPIATSAAATVTDPKAVSAHVNGGIAYEYFRSRYGRNSINDQGGTIYSTFNVKENGEDIDNAFWNGQAIFYGNGAQAFNTPIQAGLDVAGHEMCHGVIQNTANLIYQDEPGALNEAISDFYGVAIENEDFRLGEDVVNPQFFRSGALRDMGNPNNGGSSLGDPGYQPDNVRDQFRGSEDNGGVHINSGIPNFAMFKIAQAIGFQKTEEIVYRSLTSYLTRSSNFVDFRRAMETSATDVYGNGAELTAVQQAFDEVGISADGQTGTPTNTEVETNAGINFLLYVNSLNNMMELSQLVDGGFQLVADPLSEQEVISRPSISDDGTIVVYVTADNNMQFLQLNYETGQVSGGAVQSDPQPIWRSVVISKDGSKLAAITSELQPTIYVFDVLNGGVQEFELFNPTFTEGVISNNVLYPDAMQFDFSGEFLMYDALNQASNDQSGNFTYWDIGFLNVYNNANQTFGDGDISKLVTGLPDNVSIGNASFSQNSPNIIVIDYLELVYDEIFDVYNEEYSVIGINLETGESNTILTNNTITYPSYGVGDQFLVGESLENVEPDLGRQLELFFTPLGSDKISFQPGGDFIQFGLASSWGAWYANGERVLVSNNDVLINDDIKIQPNPINDAFQIVFEQGDIQNYQMVVYDNMGRRILNQEITAGNNTVSISSIDWTPGNYNIVFSTNEKIITKRVVKY